MEVSEGRKNSGGLMNFARLRPAEWTPLANGSLRAPPAALAG
jgi:hypothetical protein